MGCGRRPWRPRDVQRLHRAQEEVPGLGLDADPRETVGMPVGERVARTGSDGVEVDAGRGGVAVACTTLTLSSRSAVALGVWVGRRVPTLPALVRGVNGLGV